MQQYKNKETLIKLYNEYKSLNKIAKHLNVSKSIIYYFIKKFDIEIAQPDKLKKADYKNREVLEKVYNECLSMSKTAKYFGVSKKLILNHMKKYDIPRYIRPVKPKKEKQPKKHYTYTSSGYKMLYKPNYHRTDSKGYIREHIFIVEEHLGRFLNDNEVVHHINGIRDDNRIENLQVMTKSEHSSFHSRQWHSVMR